MAQTIGFGDLQDQQNQNQQNNQQNQGSGAPTTTPGAGQSGSVSGAGAGAAGPATGAQGAQRAAGSPATGAALGAMAHPATYNQQNQGTGFQNLQNYVQANNPSQLQQTVATGLENQNQSVLTNLGQQQQQFATQTQQNQANTNANQQLIQQILANPAAFTNPTGAPAIGGQAGASAPSNQQLQQGNQFSQLMGGQYAGPAGLTDPTSLQGQAQQAQQNAAGLSTSGGRQAVLQQLLGSPTYNTGEQKFDAALLGQGNSQALQTASAQANQLNPLVAQGIASATAQGQEQASNAAQFGQQTQGQFGTTVANLNNQLQQQAGTAQSAQNAAYQQLLTDAASGNVTQQEAQQLGVTGGEQVTGDILSGINNYITQGPVKASAQNVATGQNYATLDALKSLAGTNAPAAAQATLGQYAGQEGQAGSFAKTSDANVNQGALGSKISTDVGAYNAAEQAAQGRTNTSNTYNRWANNGGGLVASDFQQAQQWGINPQLIQAAQQEGGPGGAQEALGQALWDTMLQRTYPNGSGNSSFLNSDWTRGQVELAAQNQAAVNQQLQSQYGGESAFNIKDPTQNALQAMAQGTVINRNT